MARSSYVASGNILPYSFVKLDTSTGKTGYVAQAASGDTPIGIAAPSQHRAPLDGLQDGYCAVAGENIDVFDPADPENQTFIQVDAAYAQGTWLKPATCSSSQASGTQAASDGDVYGARMMQASFAAGDVVQCLVVVGWRGA
jgi:hypothetical protein